MNNKFIFIIPSYNNENYVSKNLYSIINQVYNNWSIIYIDDNSNDKTYENVSKIIKENNILDKTKLIRNEKKYNQSYSRFIAFKYCNDNDICCLLDGDDWLYDNYVLLKLNNFYLNNDVLITYGNMIKFENGIKSDIIRFQDYSKNIIKEKSYRKNEWIVQPLRTGRAYLFKSIPESYMKDENNEWLKVSTDMAIMWWVLEKSDGRHKMVDFPTYVYNIDSSKRFITSFDRLFENKEMLDYRIKVINYLKNYKIDK